MNIVYDFNFILAYVQFWRFYNRVEDLLGGTIKYRQIDEYNYVGEVLQYLGMEDGELQSYKKLISFLSCYNDSALMDATSFHVAFNYFKQSIEVGKEMYFNKFIDVLFEISIRIQNAKIYKIDSSQAEKAISYYEQFFRQTRVDEEQFTFFKNYFSGRIPKFVSQEINYHACNIPMTKVGKQMMECLHQMLKYMINEIETSYMY